MSRYTRLKKQLQTGDFDKRLKAISKIKKLKTAEAQELFHIALNDKRERIRTIAIRTLGTIENTEFDKLLIDSFENDILYDVRREAAKALGNKRSKEAVGSLINALKNSYLKTLHYSAVEALGKIGDEKAIEPLVNLFKEHPEQAVEAAIIDAFTNMPDEKEIDCLVRCVKYDDKLRKPAMRVLSRIEAFDPSEAINSLIQDFGKRGSIRRNAAKGLYVLGETHWIDLVWGRRSDIRALGTINDSRLIDPLIMQLAKGDVFERCDAAEALEKWANNKVIELLIDMLKNADVDMARIQAAKSLGNIKSTSAVDSLINALENDRCYLVCEYAAIALSNINDEKAISPLIRALDTRIRGCAAHSLIKFDDPRVIPALITCLENEKNDYGRDRVTKALGKTRNPNVLKQMIRLLKDKDEYVRIAAIQALGEMSDERAIEPILNITNTDKSEKVRNIAQDILDKLKMK